MYSIEWRHYRRRRSVTLKIRNVLQGVDHEARPVTLTSMGYENKVQSVGEPVTIQMVVQNFTAIECSRVGKHSAE